MRELTASSRACHPWAMVKAWLDKLEQADLVKSIKATISPNLKPEKREQAILTQCSTADCVQWLRTGKAHIALMRSSALTQDLIQVPLGTMKYRLVMPRRLLPGKFAASFDLLRNLPTAALRGSGKSDGGESRSGLTDASFTNGVFSSGKSSRRDNRNNPFGALASGHESPIAGGILRLYQLTIVLDQHLA
jgi:hypothetical protein